MIKPNKENVLRIGELAKRTQVTPRTIRFYVQEGLLPEPHFTQKNMAYYSIDCIDKIRSIKRAQKEKFLPLVVIRSILEKNSFDYAALDSPLPQEQDKASHLSVKTVTTATPSLLKNIPQKVLDTMEKREWGEYTDNKKNDKKFRHDPVLLNFLLAINRSGVSWEELLLSLQSLQQIISKAVDLEFQTLISLLMKNPDKNFSQVLQQQEIAIDNFIRAIRRKKLKQITRRYKQNMDNAYFASADEGFAVQPNAILPELIQLENSLPDDGMDIRILNDLSIGYSCAGNLNKAVQYLDRVREVFPGNLETSVRWFWHKRFTIQPGDSRHLKEQMITLVKAYPNYAMARIFLAMWYFMEARAYDNHEEILQVMSLSINELEKADDCKITDLHEWMVVQYFTGVILTAIHSPADYILRGISAFENILNRMSDLNQLYAGRMTFYSKWLWPNIYFFLGNAYLSISRYDDAENILQKGSKFKMMQPYKERLEIAIQAARQKDNRIDP